MGCGNSKAQRASKSREAVTTHFRSQPGRPLATSPLVESGVGQGSSSLGTTHRASNRFLVPNTTTAPPSSSSSSGPSQSRPTPAPSPHCSPNGHPPRPVLPSLAPTSTASQAPPFTRRWQEEQQQPPRAPREELFNPFAQDSPPRVRRPSPPSQRSSTSREDSQRRILATDALPSVRTIQAGGQLQTPRVSTPSEGGTSSTVTYFDEFYGGENRGLSNGRQVGRR